jgi:RNA polymerase sigma-32 factor
MWWIKASIQGYILRSWSLVKMGSSAAQKKLFFRLRRTKAEISALEDGDLRPEHTAKIAERLGVQENDVVEMNRRLCGDVSLITLVHTDEAGEVQDWLVDPASSPEAVYAEQEEAKLRRQASGCGKSKFARSKSSGYGMRPKRLHDATVKQRRGNDCRGPEAVPGG